MSLYGLLAMYEADLAAVSEAITQMNELSSQIVSTSDFTRETLEVDDMPYKGEYLESANGHVESALDYLSSTVVPFLNKRIAETKEEIKAYEAEQKRLKEEKENNNKNS